MKLKINKKYIIICVVFLTFTIITNILAKTDENEAKVTLITDDKMLGMLLKDISKADKRIYCAIYMFKTESNDDTTGLIKNAVINAHQKGVDIHIVLDRGDNDDLSSKYNEYTAKQFAKANIKIGYDRIDKKLHAKICVIDDITYIGSHNYTYSAMKRNSEASVRIISSDIADEAVSYILSLEDTDF